jgi:hypothetical protein
MNTAPATTADNLPATLARLDAAAVYYLAEVNRLDAECAAAKAAGTTAQLDDLRYDRTHALTHFNFACDRAATLRASR